MTWRWMPARGPRRRGGPTRRGSPRAPRSDWVGSGEALEARWHRLADAVWAGAVNIEQAHAIATALDELPDDLDEAVLGKAELHLVAEAAHFDAARLRILGRRSSTSWPPRSPRTTNAAGSRRRSAGPRSPPG